MMGKKTLLALISYVTKTSVDQGIPFLCLSQRDFIIINRVIKIYKITCWKKM